MLSSFFSSNWSICSSILFLLFIPDFTDYQYQFLSVPGSSLLLRNNSLHLRLGIPLDCICFLPSFSAFSKYLSENTTMFSLFLYYSIRSNFLFLLRLPLFLYKIFLISPVILCGWYTYVNIWPGFSIKPVHRLCFYGAILLVHQVNLFPFCVQIHLLGFILFMDCFF